MCNSEDYSHAYEAEDVWKNFLYVRSLARAALARRAPSAERRRTRPAAGPVDVQRAEAGRVTHAPAGAALCTSLRRPADRARARALTVTTRRAQWGLLAMAMAITFVNIHVFQMALRTRNYEVTPENIAHTQPRASK